MKRKFFVIGLIFGLVLILPILARSQRNEEISVFRAKIAVDQYYQIARENENWRHKTTELIEGINKEFRKQGVKVKLEIAEISLWFINENSKNLAEALDDLKIKHPLDKNDLIIGLTRKKFPPECDVSGYYVFPGYIIVKDYAEFDFNGKEIPCLDWTLLVLMHEIGHFFGLDHSKDPNSIMYPYLSPGEKFSKEEIETMNKKAREMKSGAPSK